MARKAAKPKVPKTPSPEPVKVQEWWRQEAAKNAKPQTPAKPLSPGAQRAQDLPKFKAAAKKTQEAAKVASDTAKAASGKKIYVTPNGTAQPAPIGSMKPSGANPYGNMGKLARIGTGMALADVAGMIQDATPESMHGEYATDRNPNRSAWTALNKMTGDAAIAAGEVTNAVGEGRFWNDLATSNEALNKPPAVQAALAQQDENFKRAMGVDRNQYVANLQPALDPMAAHAAGGALPAVAHPFSAPEDSDYMRSFGRNTDGVQAPFGPRIIERNGKKVLTNLGPTALPNYIDMKTLEAQKGFSPTMEFTSPINIQNGKVTPNPMYGGVPQAPELALRGLDERLGDVTGGGVPDSMEGFMVANFMQNQLRRDDIFNNKQALDLYKTQMTALPQLMQEERMRQRLPSDINYQDSQAMYQRGLTESLPATNQLREAQAALALQQAQGVMSVKEQREANLDTQLYKDATALAKDALKQSYGSESDIPPDVLGQYIASIYSGMIKGHKNAQAGKTPIFNKGQAEEKSWYGGVTQPALDPSILWQ